MAAFQIFRTNALLFLEFLGDEDIRRVGAGLLASPFLAGDATIRQMAGVVLDSVNQRPPILGYASQLRELQQSSAQEQAIQTALEGGTPTPIMTIEHQTQIFTLTPAPASDKGA